MTDAFNTNTNSLLMRARCKLLIANPWYGTMAAMFRWKASPLIGTIGVRVVDGGYVDCLYNPKFCDQLTVDEMIAVIQHEIEHIVRLHCVRVGHRDPKRWNFATDFTINGKESRPNIENLPTKKELKGVFYPEEWDDGLTSEELYDRLGKVRIRIKAPTPPSKSKSKSPGGDNGNSSNGSSSDKNSEEGKQTQKPSSGGTDDQQSNGDQQSGDGGGSSIYEAMAKNWPNKGPNGELKDIIIDPGDATEEIVINPSMGDHDIWSTSNVGEDEARQIVKELVNQASQKAGTTPGHLIDAIEKLNAPVINWKYELRQYVGRALGGRRSTWSRANRRRPEFGIKGKSNKASVRLTIGVDTSGSVSDKLLEQFFTELELISQKFKITLVQFDHGYQCHSPYHRGDWKSLEIKGRGGTSFIEFFNAIEEKGLVGKCNIVLTDGEAPYGEERNYPVLWVIMPHGDKASVTPPWGKHLFIEK